MHYHDAAIQHKKEVEVDLHFDSFFVHLAQRTLSRYAHIAHVLNSFHEEQYYKVDLKLQMWDYEAANMMEVDWRWRYYFFLDAINNLLK